MDESNSTDSNDFDFEKAFAPSTRESFFVVTANIRYDNPKDAPHDWKGRRQLLSETIKQYTPDILGTQEGRRPQIEDLQSLLNPTLTMIDAHRSWIEERMYPTLFFNYRALSVIDSGDIWLSETPDVAGSSSFKSQFPRLCTWAKMSFKSNLRPFTIVNVHLDHVLPETRLAQTQVLCQEIHKVNAERYPLIFIGDYNESPQGDVRKTINDNFPNLVDPWGDFINQEEGTHHHFDGNNKEAQRIDWILADKRLKVKNLVLDKTSKNGLYPTDHFLVMAEFSFN